MGWVNGVVLAFFLGSTIYARVPQKFEIYGAKTKADLIELSACGFTQFVLEDEKLQKEADSLSLPSVQANWFGTKTETAQILRALRSAKELRHLVSVNLMDEPIHNDPVLHPPHLYQTLRELSHKENLIVPLSLTEYGPSPRWDSDKLKLFREYLPAIDLYRLSNFPVVANRPLGDIYHWVQNARLLMEKRQIPITAILQTWADGEMSGVPKLPTLEELRVMSYLALISEVDAISFFDYNPTVWELVPGFAKGFFALLAELKAFSAPIRGWSVATAVPEPGVFRARFESDRKTVVLWINSNREKAAGLEAMQVLMPRHLLVPKGD